MPKFALVLTSTGREAELRRLLRSLRDQEMKDFIIFSGDQSAGKLDRLWPEFQDLPLVVIPLPRRGVSWARNALSRIALAGNPEFVAYPDDDCWYAPDTLQKAASALAKKKSGLDALVGSWSAGSGKRPRDRTGAISRYSAFSRGETYVQFYRASLVRNVGEWDESLGPGTGLPYGCGEDTDFLLRALKLSDRIMRVPEVRVFHPLPGMGHQLRDRWISYARGRMRLLRKHNFPLMFRLANVLWPLARIPLERPGRWPYRLAMFSGRLTGLLERTPRKPGP